MKNYYVILELPMSATPTQLRTAYYRKAKVAHPDGGGSPAEFRVVNEAYEILGDPEKRREYDRERSDWAKRIGACLCVGCGSANIIKRRPKAGESVTCAHCKSPLPIDLNSAISLQKVRLASEAVKVIDSVGVQVAEAAVDIISAQIGKLRQRFAGSGK